MNDKATSPGNPKQFGLYDFTSRQAMDDLFDPKQMVQQIDTKTGHMKSYHPVHWDADGVIDALTDTSDAESLAAQTALAPQAAALARSIAAHHDTAWTLKAQEEWEIAVTRLCVEYMWDHPSTASNAPLGAAQTAQEQHALDALQPYLKDQYTSAVEVNAALAGRIAVLDDVPAKDVVCRHKVVKMLELLKYCEDAKLAASTWHNTDKPKGINRTEYELCTGAAQFGSAYGYHAYVRINSGTGGLIETNTLECYTDYVYMRPQSSFVNSSKDTGDSIAYTPINKRFTRLYSGGWHNQSEARDAYQHRRQGHNTALKTSKQDMHTMSRLEYTLARNDRAHSVFQPNNADSIAFGTLLAEASTALEDTNTKAIAPIWTAIKDSTRPDLVTMRDMMNTVAACKRNGLPTLDLETLKAAHTACVATTELSRIVQMAGADAVIATLRDPTAPVAVPRIDDLGTPDQDGLVKLMPFGPSGPVLQFQKS